MRRSGHIRQRSRDSFELRYGLGTDPATGKRRVVTTTVRGDRRAAEKELRRLHDYWTQSSTPAFTGRSCLLFPRE